MIKEEALATLVTEIRACRRCPLWEEACQAVPGEGDPDAKIFFVGEAPGKQEDLTGRPFVGRSGRLVDMLLTGIGLARDEVFIGNLVKHRPPGNRCPKPGEIHACTPFLDRQIGVVEPTIIVTLGRVPANYLFSWFGMKFEKLGDIRGRAYSVERDDRMMTVLPMYHPASALRNPLHRAVMEQDFDTLGRLIDESKI